MNDLTGQGSGRHRGIERHWRAYPQGVERCGAVLLVNYSHCETGGRARRRREFEARRQSRVTVATSTDTGGIFATASCPSV